MGLISKSTADSTEAPPDTCHQGQAREVPIEVSQTGLIFQPSKVVLKEQGRR